MSFIKDTKPRPPFQDEPLTKDRLINPMDDDRGGPGCLLWALIGAGSLVGALIVVLLAAMAGWTAGQREAHVIGTATKSSEIQAQLDRIPTDVANRNLVLLDRRLGFLVTLTPGIPQVPQIVETATALYLTSQPTSTATPTLTPTPSPTVEVTEEVQVALPESTGSTYDLDAYLAQARTAIDSAQYADGIELLEAIIAVDSTFQRQTVNSLMLQALRAEANRLYTEQKLAEAIFRTDQAETYGLSQDDPLRYEKYAAGLYLDAERTIGTDPISSIRAWQAVYNLGPGRYYEEAATKLFQQYVIYGDAWSLQNEHCPAYVQYQNALQVRSSSEVAGKRDLANTLCSQATPTLGPGMPTPDPNVTQQPIAPVGQVGS